MKRKLLLEHNCYDLLNEKLKEINAEYDKKEKKFLEAEVEC